MQSAGVRVFCVLLLSTITQTSGITISTRIGRIEGITADVNNVTVHQFLGIPFAKPPLGKLRFRKPEPYGNWTGTLKATTFGPSCMQDFYENDKRLIPNLNITEDCLQLNVFVPGNIDKRNWRAVMVWVHGGGFTNGQATMFNGSYLSSRSDVIVVTINYRLNVFGFLYAGMDSNYKGHYGLFDQQLAFKWVKDNIEDFGGNPHIITIFGESAGGVSVTLQSILASNLGLFQRVIAESGSVLMPVDLDGTQTSELTKQTAKLLNCSRANMEDTIACLQTIDAPSLMANYFKAMPHFFKFSFTFAGELLNQSLFNDLAKNNSPPLTMLRSLDVMAGTNAGEAGLEFFDLLGYQKPWKFNVSKGIPERILCKHIIPMANAEIYKGCDDLNGVICDSYVKNSSTSASLQDQTQAAMDFYADISMNYPTFQFLKIHSDKTTMNTYQYTFDHTPTWELIQERPSWLRGPNHASELAFVFGLKDWYPRDVHPTSAELVLSHQMMDMWTNFAKTGNPNNGNTSLWRPFNRNNHYLSLDIPLKSGVSLYGKRMEFLLKDVPEIARACKNQTYVVSTSLGKIRGTIVEVDSQKIVQFRKIPYAVPPVGDLRFAKPLPITPWNETMDSTTFGPSCMQTVNKEDSHLVSEDCLHLNIYAPFPVLLSSDKPVMIWIHGGGFTSGQGKSTDGSRLSLKGDVIVVTINYRLNVFGFFSMGNPNARGNFGLYDQQLAIKWVYENIHAFGGDPNKITLFGESAGGVSTTIQGVIPSNVGLFKRVIGESGSVLARRDYQTKTYETSKQIIKNIHCEKSSDTEILGCLRSQNASVLLQTWQQIDWKKPSKASYSMTTSIGPITDGELIPESPETALKNPKSSMYRQFTSVDLLVGTNTADSGLLYFNLKPYAQIFDINVTEGVPTRIVCDEMAPSIVREIFNIKCSALTEAICKQYSPKSPATLQAESQMAADLYGDFLEDVPTIKSLNYHAQSVKSTFQYLFSHRPNWEIIGDRPPWLVGANHASEIPFVFGLKSFYPPTIPITQEEETLAERMMEYWINFARYGNPNGNSSGYWRPYTVEGRDYLNLDLNITMSSSLYKDRVDFWTTTVPDIVRQCQPHPVNSSTTFLPNSLVLFVNVLAVICILI